MSLDQGPQPHIRRIGPNGNVLEPNSPLGASAIDVLCVATEALVGQIGTPTGAGTGSDAVHLDVAALAAISPVRGLPRVKKTSSGAVEPVFGVVHWGEGSVASGAKVWVRIFGEHPYAKVDGSTSVAVNAQLRGNSATAGALGTTASVIQGTGIRALEAQGNADVRPRRVLLGWDHKAAFAGASG